MFQGRRGGWEGEGTAASSVGGDLRDLRLGRLVGGLDEHGLGQLLAGGHRHLLDLIELLQYTHNHQRSALSGTLATLAKVAEDGVIKNSYLSIGELVELLLTLLDLGLRDLNARKNCV